MTSTDEPRYYVQDSRNACTSTLWTVKDRRGRSMDGAPITVASGLYPDQAYELARLFNSAAEEPITAALAAELALHGLRQHTRAGALRVLAFLRRGAAASAGAAGAEEYAYLGMSGPPSDAGNL